jgi:hypothetical protein
VWRKAREKGGVKEGDKNAINFKIGGQGRWKKDEKEEIEKVGLKTVDRTMRPSTSHSKKSHR